MFGAIFAAKKVGMHLDRLCLFRTVFPIDLITAAPLGLSANCETLIASLSQTPLVYS
jgi:hypothetical protein